MTLTKVLSTFEERKMYVYKTIYTEDQKKNLQKIIVSRAQKSVGIFE